MKQAFPLPRLLPLVLVSGVLLLPPKSEAQEAKLSGFVLKRTQQLESLVNSDLTEDSAGASQSPSRPHRAASRPVAGLGNPSLGNSSLQTNTNLDSTARAMRPSGEWRQIFPKKKH